MTTVLVVDDNALDRKIAGQCVEKSGWTPAFAENGHEAMQKIEEDPPDVILTDLQMPEMDGLELVQQVKARFPRIPIVLVTAKGSEEIAVSALKSGASSYVPKRKLARDFDATLRAVVEAAESRLERQQLLDVMTATESQFVLGYDPAGPRALVSYCQDAMRMMHICDDADLLRVGTALHESLTNAIEHGNLELDSSLRDGDEGSYEAQKKQRQTEPPYSERRVHVTSFVSQTEARYVIRDEGNGFDWKKIPDPSDSATVSEPSNRGLMLIHALMDEVRFNEHGNEITLVKTVQA